MRLKGITKLIQIAIESEKGDTMGFAQMFINGDTGTIYGLNGSIGATAVLFKNINDIVHKYDLTNVNAVFEEKIIDMIERKNYNKEIKITRIKTVNVNGINMIDVNFSKEKENESIEP